MNRKKIKQEEEDIVIEMVSIIDRLYCDIISICDCVCTLFLFNV